MIFQPGNNRKFFATGSAFVWDTLLVYVSHMLDDAHDKLPAYITCTSHTLTFTTMSHQLFLINEDKKIVLVKHKHSNSSNTPNKINEKSEPHMIEFHEFSVKCNAII